MKKIKLTQDVYRLRDADRHFFDGVKGQTVEVSDEMAERLVEAGQAEGPKKAAQGEKPKRGRGAAQTGPSETRQPGPAKEGSPGPPETDLPGYSGKEYPDEESKPAPGVNSLD